MMRTYAHRHSCANLSDGWTLETYAEHISKPGTAWGVTEAEAFAQEYNKRVVIFKCFGEELRPVSAHGDPVDRQFNLLCSDLVGGMEYNLLFFNPPHDGGCPLIEPQKVII